jgi:hypothetical protein
MRDAQSGIEIKIVGLLVRQASSAVVEAEKAAKSSVRTLPWPPKFRRCYGVSGKIYEILEKSGPSSRLRSPFVTDIFFARETYQRKVVIAIV